MPAPKRPASRTPPKRAAKKAVKQAPARAAKAAGKDPYKSASKAVAAKVAAKPAKKPVKAPAKPVAQAIAKSAAPAKAAPALKLVGAEAPRPAPSSKPAPAKAAAPALRLAPAPAAPAAPAEPALPAQMPRPGEDRHAWFSRIAQQYYRFFFATALPIVRNAEDAEDVVQAAVLNALRRLDQLDDPGAVVGWLAMITRNAALDLLRRKKRTPSGSDVTVLPIAAPESDKAQYQMEDDLRSVLTAAIAHLPPNQQEVVNLRHFEGLEIAQISLRLGITENNARVRLFRAYEHLRHDPRVRAALAMPDMVPQDEE